MPSKDALLLDDCVVIILLRVANGLPIADPGKPIRCNEALVAVPFPNIVNLLIFYSSLLSLIT
jgi:hypothetical protein